MQSYYVFYEFSRLVEAALEEISEGLAFQFIILYVKTKSSLSLIFPKTGSFQGPAYLLVHESSKTSLLAFTFFPDSA